MMLFLFAVLFHLFLYWPLEFFSYPEFHIYPYLVNRGLIPYRQIIDQLLFPGFHRSSGF